MKRHIRGVWLACLAVILFVTGAFGYYINPPIEEEIADGWVCGNQLFVKLKAGYSQTDLSSALGSINAVVEEKIALPDSCFLVSWDSSASVENFYDAVAALSLVDKVGYDHWMDLNQYLPQETHFADQWGLRDTQTPGFDIDAPEAWCFSQGNDADVAVYLVDSGHLLNGDDPPIACHQDFSNPGQVANGAWSVTPQGDDEDYCHVWGPYDNYGHATAMATILNARWGASSDYHAGIAPNCKLVVAGILQSWRLSTGTRYLPQTRELDLANALRWILEVWNANQNNPPIKVTVVPWTCQITDWSLIEERIQILADNDILVVAASGHRTSQQAATILYPAAFATYGTLTGHTTGYSNVLACTAYQRDGESVGWARYVFHNSELHPEALIAAPGGKHAPNNTGAPDDCAEDVAVDFSDPQECGFGMDDPDEVGTAPLCLPSPNDPQPLRGRYTGTSFAAAHVGGVAALVLSLNPELTPAEVREILISAATETEEAELGGGRLNALRAVLRTPVTKTLQENLTIPTDISSVYIAGSVVVPANKTLTIQPGVTVTMAPGASITVQNGGVLNAVSTNPQQLIRFEAEDNTALTRWAGISLGSGTHSLRNCIVSNADIGITAAVSGAVVHLTECSFDNIAFIAVSVGNGAYVNWTSCTVNESGFYGIVAYATRSRVTASGGIIRNCNHAGIWAVSQAYVILDSVEVFENGVAEPTYEPAGLRSMYSSYRLHCTSIHDNYGPGLTMWGGMADMAYASGTRGKNCIQDNLAFHQNQLPVQIAFSHTRPNLCNGRNLICAETGQLIVDATPGTGVDVTNNYWCGDPTGLIPPQYLISSLDEDDTPYPNRCELDAAGPCTWSVEAEAFNIAWEQENALQFAQAMEGYENIIKDYPNSDEAKLCPDRILFCEGMLDEDWQKQRDYFLDVADTTSNADLALAARGSAAWCLVELGEPEDAQDELLALMDSTLGDFEYQRLALESLFAELHDTKIDSLIMKSGSADTAKDRLANALDQAEQMLNGVKLPLPHSAPALPTKYNLYQNYPNPFNPTTEIRFDLPENAPVELKIFNTLGQHVMTLINEVRQAGSYTVKWDGKNADGLPVSTGMYIYQLKASNFTDTKKMLMMK